MEGGEVIAESGGAVAEVEELSEQYLDYNGFELLANDAS